MTPEIRAFLADVMDGKRQQPRRKTSPTHKGARNYEMVERVLTKRSRGEKNAIESVAADMDLGVRQVSRAMKKYRPTLPTIIS